MSSSSAEIMRVRLTADGIQEVMDAMKKVQNETKRTKDTADSATKALGALGTIFAAQQIASFANRALDAADQLFKMSQKTGVAVEQLSTFSYVAQQADVSQEDLTKGFGKLSKSLDALSSGDEATVKAFQRIGLSFEDLKGLSLDQVLLKISNAQSGFADGAGKAAVMMQIFGKAGANMIPMLNDLANGGFENAKSKLQDLGLVITSDMAKAAQDFNDSMTRLEMAAQGATVQVAQSMLPGLTKAIDGLTGSLAGMPASVKAFSGSFVAVGAAATAATVAVRSLYTAIAGLGPIGIAAIAISALVAGIISLQAAEEQAQAEELQALERRSKFVSSSSDLEKAYRKEASALEKSTGNQKESDKHSRRLKEIQDQLISMSPELQKALGDESKSWKDKADAIKAAREEAEKNQEIEKKKLEQDLIDARKKMAEEKAMQDAPTPTMDIGAGRMGRGLKEARSIRLNESEGLVKSLEAKLAALSGAKRIVPTEEDKKPIPEKQDDSASKSKVAEAVAASKRELEVSKAQLEDFSQMNDRLFKNGLIDLNTYLAARATAIRQGTEAEVKALQAQLQAEEGAKADTPAEKQAKNTKISDLKNQIQLKQQDGERKLQSLEEEGRQKRTESALESLKLESELEAAKGKTGEAAIRAIEAEYDERIRTAKATDREVLQSLKENAVNRKKMEGLQTQESLASKQLDSTLSVIDRNESNGTLDPFTAAQQRVAAYQQWLDVVTQLHGEMQVLANDIGDEGLSQQVQELGIKIDDASIKTKTLSDSFADVKKVGADALASGLVTALSEISSGTKSVSEAFKDMANSIVSSIQQALIKAMLLKAAMAILGPQAPGSFGASFISALGGNADGGRISGPGTSTSDSILARLSDGEYVAKAASVRYYGPEFFDALNGMKIPRHHLPGYADGGLIGGAKGSISPAATPHTTNVVNVFDPSLVEGLMSTPRGELAVLNVIGNNPEYIRALLA